MKRPELSHLTPEEILKGPTLAASSPALHPEGIPVPRVVSPEDLARELAILRGRVKQLEGWRDRVKRLERKGDE